MLVPAVVDPYLVPYDWSESCTGFYWTEVELFLCVEVNSIDIWLKVARCSVLLESSSFYLLFTSND